MPARSSHPSRYPLALLPMMAVLASSPAAGAGTPPPAPLEQNAVVTGKVLADSECAKTADRRPSQVWLSVGQILLQQLEVPIGGSFEFHVRPGKYELGSTNSKGCLAHLDLTLASGKTETTELRLSSARNPAATTK